MNAQMFLVMFVLAAVQGQYQYGNNYNGQTYTNSYSGYGGQGSQNLYSNKIYSANGVLNTDGVFEYYLPIDNQYQIVSAVRGNYPRGGPDGKNWLDTGNRYYSGTVTNGDGSTTEYRINCGPEFLIGDTVIGNSPKRWCQTDTTTRLRYTTTSYTSRYYTYPYYSYGSYYGK